MKLRVTEYLDLDLDQDKWCCNKCGAVLNDADKNYKEACLIYERNPNEVHRPLVEAEYNFSPDPNWVRIIEFYCPSCGAQMETEYLPPGHPLTHDIEIDVAALKARVQSKELGIKEGRLYKSI
ncbi:acetone carboxylase subunit gamma [Paradesulfitobacterium ferrireducens]|uniref:acetone carboxylase subunit gamma n=1 Tax=Paradesulfitobacterium ferrireducens TaxID=2816476 RepID=UPI001A8BFC79|nr:acetone carboxylase subunit gamma [Paradesulfitobacterium ferrireducens]